MGMNALMSSPFYRRVGNRTHRAAMHMAGFRQITIVALALGSSLGPALGSAGFSCQASDKNIETLIVEGATPRSGGGLINFSGVIEIEPGKKIEFGKRDVTRFVWRKNLWIDVRKKLDRRTFFEIKFRTHMKEEKEPFPGTYSVRTEKAKRSGKLSCTSD